MTTLAELHREMHFGLGLAEAMARAELLWTHGDRKAGLDEHMEAAFTRWWEELVRRDLFLAGEAGDSAAIAGLFDRAIEQQGPFLRAEQLLAALEESGIADRTLVIFSADNGPESYAYPRDAAFDHWSSHPLRGLKRDIYDGGHRVPYVVNWPGKVPAGKVSHELVSQIDIMATLAAVVDFPLPESAAEDSHNLLPLWTGATTEGPRKHHVHNTNPQAFAIRSGNWTLIKAETGYHSGGYQAWEKKHGYSAEDAEDGFLFDLSEDIGQRKNLIDQHPEKAKELATLLQQIRDQGYSSPRLSN